MQEPSAEADTASSGGDGRQIGSPKTEGPQDPQKPVRQGMGQNPRSVARKRRLKTATKQKRTCQIGRKNVQKKPMKIKNAPTSLYIVHLVSSEAPVYRPWQS